MAKEVPGLTTFQVLQNKANSIKMKPELLLAHRPTRISVCMLGLSAGTQTAILEVSPEEGTCCLGPFPTGKSLDFPAWLRWDVGQNPLWRGVLCCFYLSFLVMLVYLKFAR